MTTYRRRRRAHRRGRVPTWGLISALVVLSALFIVAALVRTSETSGPSATRIGLDDARHVLANSATIQVIGDSTGNDANEWVAFWAQHLGRDHRVTLHQWLDGEYRPDPLSYGEDGPRITIWNASQAGGSANWAVKQIDVAQPENPDLVLLNLGKNNTSTNVAGELDQLISEIDSEAPVVLILQNPSRGGLERPQVDTSRALQVWAATRGVPTIDAGAAFTHPDSQMYDDVHPNEAGSRAWADVIANALE